MADVVAAAKAANIHSFIVSLPKVIITVIVFRVPYYHVKNCFCMDMYEIKLNSSNESTFINNC